MRACGLLGVRVFGALGCSSAAKGVETRVPNPAHGAKGTYEILGESEHSWIVKVRKRPGQGIVDGVAEALRGTSPERDEKAARAGTEGAGAGTVTGASPKPEEKAEGVGGGTVRGRIARGAEGVPDCQVKLTPMCRSLGLLQWEESTGDEIAAVTTDSSGGFQFQGVPAGAYRLKWAVPGATHWVKRLKEDPDVIVEAGGTAFAADVDTSRPVR